MNLRGSEYSIAVTATPGAIRADALAYAYAATGTVRANAYIFEMLSAVRHISLSMVAAGPAQEAGLDACVPPRSRIFRALSRRPSGRHSSRCTLSNVERPRWRAVHVGPRGRTRPQGKQMMPGPECSPLQPTSRTTCPIWSAWFPPVLPLLSSLA